jgi:hypothetical protein
MNWGRFAMGALVRIVSDGEEFLMWRWESSHAPGGFTHCSDGEPPLICLH